MNDCTQPSLDTKRHLDIQEQLDKKARQKDLLQRIVPYAGLAFIFLFFIIVTGGKFLNEANRINLVNQSFTLTIICVGACFVYGHGGADFSIGATCGCGQLLAAVLLTQAGFPMWFCLLACILVTVFGACLTASISLVLNVIVFVGSMCIRTIFSGILTTATQQQVLFVSHIEYGYMDNTLLKGIILIVFIAVGYYLFEHTAFGANLRAIGGNKKTANQTGIKIKKNVLIAYIILGVCVGVAAIFQMFRNATVDSNAGNGLEFNMMMAIVLGGFPFSGGEKARMSSAIVGALTVTILMNGLTFWGVDANMLNLVKGVLFVSIIALSYDRSMGKLVEQQF